MKLSFLLHFYQPADQQADILDAVVAQSYRPIINFLKNTNNISINLNINGSLLDLFDKYKYYDLIDGLRLAGERNIIEFTSSVKYHAFLPFLPEDEIQRQIIQNNQTNKYYLGDAYKPLGFFPPEMGYHPKILPIIKSFGYKWIILDEIAYCADVDKVDYTKLYKDKSEDIYVFFRERRISNSIMSAVVRDEASVNQLFGNRSNNSYTVAAMDGETFGHHRPGLENFLFDLLSNNKFKFVNLSSLLQDKRDEVLFSPVLSTWASSKLDIEKNIQFLSWNDPENIIHKWQHEFVDMVLNEVKRLENNKDQDIKLIREKMDKALASDHYWWASAKPWWSLEMIEDGAYKLLEIVDSLPNIDKDIQIKAHRYYEQILSTAFSWQRSGKIRKMAQDQNKILRIPFKDRTVGEGGGETGVYYAFIDMMKLLEKRAVDNQNYEKAILWRDAIYKLDKKLDIYDAINAIDLVRLELPHEEIENMIAKYKDKYHKLRGGQPEQRGS